MSNPVCSKCGNPTDNGYVSVHPQQDTSYTTLNPSGKHDTIMLKAVACLTCGNVDLNVDPNQLRSIAKS